MLREQEIEHFENDYSIAVKTADIPKKQRFNMDELENLECLLLSHNYIKDLYAISQITSLLELNLSFN